MAKYYSVQNFEFATEPKPDSKCIKFGNKYAKKKYFFKVNRFEWNFIDHSPCTLNLNDKCCTCKYYIKHMICGHLLALNKALSNDEFVNKPKRGGQKKAASALLK